MSEEKNKPVKVEDALAIATSIAYTRKEVNKLNERIDSLEGSQKEIVEVVGPQGEQGPRGSSSYTQYAKIDNSGIDDITSYKGKTAFNAALDTVVTVDNLKYRISNQGGVFPQVASASGSTVDVAYSAVGYVNGATNPATAHNSGYILAADGTWLSLYSSHGMDDRGDFITFHLVDKGAGKIYRVTYMVTNNSSNVTGYNILVERLI